MIPPEYAFHSNISFSPSVPITFSVSFLCNRAKKARCGGIAEDVGNKVELISQSLIQ
jgi:hypothetical protein